MNFILTKLSRSLKYLQELKLTPLMSLSHDLLIKVQTTQSEVRLVSPIIMLKELIGKKYKKGRIIFQGQ